MPKTGKKDKPIKAVLGGQVEFQLGMTEGRIWLNEPTNQEWNEYFGTISENDAKKEPLADIAAAAKLFDLLFDRAENVDVQKDGKPVELSRDTLRYVPDRKKEEAIRQGFLLKVDFLRKN